MRPCRQTVIIKINLHFGPRNLTEGQKQIIEMNITGLKIQNAPRQTSKLFRESGRGVELQTTENKFTSYRLGWGSNSGPPDFNCSALRPLTPFPCCLPFSSLFPDRGGRDLGIFGWECAAGTLEPLAYTRTSLPEFCYPILD